MDPTPGITGDARLVHCLLHPSRNTCETHLETGPRSPGHHVKLRH